MIDFVRFVIYELKNSIVFFIIASAILAAGVLLYCFICKRIYKKDVFSWKRAIAYITFAGYCLVVVYVTLFREGTATGVYNIHLFRAWREAWNNYTLKAWLNVFLNIGLFVPLGVLFHTVFFSNRKWCVALATGFAFSLLLETVQLFLKNGVFDVDDIFNNTLGTIVGFSSVEVIRLLVKRRKSVKELVAHTAFLLATIVAVGSIFAVYELKEYGNLPGSSTFRVNTEAITWNQMCELPLLDGSVPTFCGAPLSNDDVTAFGEKISGLIQVEFDDVVHYDEETHFMDHGGDGGAHFLIISKRDGCYDYSVSYIQEPDVADVERDVIEEALAKFQITIPKQAEFVNKGKGWHRFEINNFLDGQIMLNGTIDCRYASDGTVLNLINNVQTYVYYDDVEIILPQEALDKLRRGYIGNGEAVEQCNSSEYNIVNCSLEYKIDTKWFYQPVYVFDIIAEDEDCQIQVFVPAMK